MNKNTQHNFNISEWPKVAIIILNWNNWRDTIECLESLQRLTYKNYQIIVVDNGSIDDSIEKVKAWAHGKIRIKSSFFDYNLNNKSLEWIEYDRKTAELGGDVEIEKKIDLLPSNQRLVIIRNEYNLGFAGGNNVALRYILHNLHQYAFFWMVNNDTVVDKTALEMLVRKAMGGTSKIIGSKVLWYEYPEVIQTAGGGRILPWLGVTKAINENARFDDKENVFDYISGTSLFAQVDVLKNVGLFDESYFLYWEEVDWCERARKKGYRLGYEPQSLVWHKVGSSLCHVSPLADYYNAMGMVYYLKKHHKVQLLGALSIGLFGKIVRRLIRGQIQNIGTVLRGTLKGVILH